MRSEATEDYLKAIYRIRREHGRVNTTVLAERLGVAPASATGMIKKLAVLGLVRHEPYRGVALTDRGEVIALKVIRRHRLAELYLATALGVPWDRVHAEAEEWEHVISEEIEDRMDGALGHPEFDPHGAPIPGRDQSFTVGENTRMADLATGEAATLAEVDDRDPELLRYAASLGLHPGVRVCVVAQPLDEGPLHIRVGDVDRLLSRAAAREMFVTDVATCPGEAT